MDPASVSKQCQEIIKMYSDNDSEYAHICEDVFLHKFLRHVAAQIKNLPTCDSAEVDKLKVYTEDCMKHIEDLLNTRRTKWFG